MKEKIVNVSTQAFPNYLVYPVPYVDISQTVRSIPNFEGIVIPFINTQGRVREVIQDIPVVIPFEGSNTDVITPRREDVYEPVTGLKRIRVRRHKPVFAPRSNTKYKPSSSYSNTEDVYTEFAPRYYYEYSPRFRRASTVLPEFDQVGYDSYYYAIGQRQRALWKIIRETMR